eukprot:217935_1
MSHFEKEIERNDKKDSILLELSGEFKCHPSNGITSIGISKNKPNTIITCSNNGMTVIWNIKQTQKIHKKSPFLSRTIVKGNMIKKMKCHKSSIGCIDIDSNGEYFITGSIDKTIKLWNLNTFTLKRVFNEHKQKILYLSLSNNGKIAYSLSSDNTLIIWNTMGKIIKKTKYKQIITHIIISPNNKYLIIAFIGYVKIYNIKQNNHIDSTFKIYGVQNAKYKLAISPDSSCIACGDANGLIE